MGNSQQSKLNFNLVQATEHKSFESTVVLYYAKDRFDINRPLLSVVYPFFTP